MTSLYSIPARKAKPTSFSTMSSSLILRDTLAQKRGEGRCKATRTYGADRIHRGRHHRRLFNGGGRWGLSKWIPAFAGMTCGGPR
jgi:hypothetical protein